VLRQATPAAAPLKRSRPTSPGAASQPLPARALPISIWGDHKLPLQTCKDAARLGATCKALRGVVREHLKAIGRIYLGKLQGALTAFPEARTVELYVRIPTNEALVQGVLQGGRGRGLEAVTLEMVNSYGFREDFLHRALRAGALPSLKSLAACLKYPDHRASLTEGLVAGMHELRLSVECMSSMGAQLAALGLVRQLPALAKLEISVCMFNFFARPVQWPPFIPPSLKALCIRTSNKTARADECLLRALPGMLAASGAQLECLEVILSSNFKHIGDVLVYVAQALRCSSPTLKEFLLKTWNTEALGCFKTAAENYDGQVERLRVQWADLLAGLSACRELEVLVLPRIETVSLFPPGTAFGRLTHLEISDQEREHPPDAGMMGLWELMASGGLPALAKLSVRLEGRWVGVEEVRSRVVPALEAAAGTLTHLHLEKGDYHTLRNKELSLDVG
jgi:hypothetical protein